MLSEYIGQSGGCSLLAVLVTVGIVAACTVVKPFLKKVVKKMRNGKHRKE